ncbi:MAG: ribose-phosphate pyrophosphokinase [Planctomycetota bacterium]|nr:MAG: ribose-phosphate pyrophosphokinase [Planctomycetota bacterium]
MMTLYNGLALLAGTAHPPLAKAISEILEQPLCSAEVGRFPDGEVNVKLSEDVRGKDVFILQPTCPPVNENLVELLTLIDCCKRSSVGRITAVMPYFGYARKDRKDEGRVPITAKLVADLLTVAGVDRVIAMDLHAPQIQGFFNVPVDHLYAKPVFRERFAGFDRENTTIVAPDAGGIKMARAYSSMLGMNFAIVDKRRMGPAEVVSENLIGHVDGQDVILVDDMVATAGTIVDASRMVRAHGAKKVWIAATHGVFAGPALERLAGADLEGVIVTDTVCPQSEYPDVIETLSVAPLLAETIHRIHVCRSVSSLFLD